MSWNVTFVSVITINQRFKIFTGLDNHDKRLGFVIVKRIETEFALFRLVEDASKEGSENVLVFKARFFFLLRRP